MMALVMNPCAVLTCDAEGLAFPCPYDGAFHRHGRIHYDCGFPESSLVFRSGWHLICAEHYEICRREREEMALLYRMYRGGEED